jgi:hypothetical protein
VVVLIAGMPRSGSTFSFNVARAVLIARGSVYQEANDDAVGVACRAAGKDHVIIKSHNPDEQSIALASAGAMRIIMTVRRVEDAMASWLRTFSAVPEDAGLQIMRGWLLAFAKLKSKALVVPFEQIDTRPFFAAWRIATAICPIISPFEVLRISRSLNKAAVKARYDALAKDDPGVLDLGFSYCDGDTFFHRRHVSDLHSSLAEHLLPPDRLQAIRSSLGSAIAAAGL